MKSKSYILILLIGLLVTVLSARGLIDSYLLELGSDHQHIHDHDGDRHSHLHFSGSDYSDSSKNDDYFNYEHHHSHEFCFDITDALHRNQVKRFLKPLTYKVACSPILSDPGWKSQHSVRLRSSLAFDTSPHHTLLRSIIMQV